MKRAQIIYLTTLLLLCVSLRGEDSFYKFRIYKPFIEDIFKKNMKLIFSRAHHLQTDDIMVEDLDGAMVQNLFLQIRPIDSQMDESSVEVFFDEGGIITLEMHDLELIGSGRMEDPD